MAKYTITRACGHTETVNICGTNVHGERERQAEFEATKVCYECYLAEKAARVEQAETADNLPELEGSQKQVAWAKDLRAAKLYGNSGVAYCEKEFADLAEEDQQTCRQAIASIKAQTSAAWWIDNRQADLWELMWAAAGFDA